MEFLLHVALVLEVGVALLLRGSLLAVYMSAVHVLLFVAMQSHAQHHD